jgi:hypothetical protein
MLLNAFVPGTVSADLLASQDHGPPCRGCRRARLTLECACCGRRTSVVALASSICHVEYCRACWDTLVSLHVGKRLPRWWPVREYLAQGQDKEAIGHGSERQHEGTQPPACGAA